MTWRHALLGAGWFGLLAGVAFLGTGAGAYVVPIDTAGALGVTICGDDDVVVWIRRPQPGQRWNVDAAHEFTHVRQCLSHSPAWWDSMTASPTLEAALEAEAYCVDSLVNELHPRRCAGVERP